MAAFVLGVDKADGLLLGVKVSVYLDDSTTICFETDSACPRYYQSERGSEGPSWLATDRIAPDGSSAYRSLPK